MGKLLSTSKSSNDSTREPIIIPGLQSMPTTGPENKGILKSAAILNQPGTSHKSSTNHQQPSPQHIQWSKVQWHLLPGGTKEKYILCGDCKYQTTSQVSLDSHIKEMHFISTTTQQKTTMIKEKSKFHCVHCPFKARSTRDFEKHNSCHRNQAAKYQCPLCSFSVDMICNLNPHLKLHSGEIDEAKSTNNICEPQNAEKDAEQLPNLSSNTNNSRSESRMLNVSLQPTGLGHDESNTRQDDKGTLNSPIINENTNGKSSSIQTYSAPIKGKEHCFTFGQRKRYKCGDCNYQTSSRVSMTLHIELMHPTSAITSFQLVTTTIKGDTSEEIGKDNTCNNEHSNAEIEDRIVPVLPNNNSTEFEAIMRKQFGIKECSVILHDDIHSSSVKVVNPENMEVLPFEEDDQIEDVERKDEKIQSLQSRLMVMEERAHIAEEEVTQILSRKMDLLQKVIEMAGRRLVIEYDLRLEQCSLLGMSISALDEGGDHSALTEPVDEKVKTLQEKMDVIDSQLEVLKGEEDSLAQDLDYAYDSHLGLVQVIEALQSELGGLYCC